MVPGYINFSRDVGKCIVLELKQNIGELVPPAPGKEYLHFLSGRRHVPQTFVDKEHRHIVLASQTVRKDIENGLLRGQNTRNTNIDQSIVAEDATQTHIPPQTPRDDGYLELLRQRLLQGLDQNHWHALLPVLAVCGQGINFIAGYHLPGQVVDELRLITATIPGISWSGQGTAKRANSADEIQHTEHYLELKSGRKSVSFAFFNQEVDLQV